MKIRRIFSVERMLHNWPIKAFAIVFALLLNFIYQSSTFTERFLTVPLEILLESDFIPASPYSTTVRVTLRGRDDVNYILPSDIEAVADFSSVNEAGMYTAPIIISKKGYVNEIRPLEIIVDPIDVKLPIEKRLSKTISVESRLVGHTAKGYSLANSYLVPSSVTVEGPSSRIQGMERIFTEHVDISGRYDSFTLRVELVRPDPLVNIIGGNFVEFHAELVENRIMLDFKNTDIVLLDLNPQLELAEELVPGVVRVHGSEAYIDTLGDSEVQLILDCSDIDEPGTYLISLRVSVPEDLIVLDYAPKELEITFLSVEDGGNP